MSGKHPLSKLSVFHFTGKIQTIAGRQKGSLTAFKWTNKFCEQLQFALNCLGKNVKNKCTCDGVQKIWCREDKKLLKDLFAL